MNSKRLTGRNAERVRIGQRNLYALYAFTATSRLWFDGGLWVIYFQHRGLSLLDIGLLEALLHTTCLITDVPIGIFADRFGWKRALGLSAVCGVVYTVTSLVTSNVWCIAMAFVARGLQSTFASGSDSAIAYESAVWAGVVDRYRAISGRLFAILLVSMGVAEVTGGALANIAWSGVYIAFTLANVVSLVFVLLLKEPRENVAGGTEGRRPSTVETAKNAYRFAKENPKFLKWLVLSGTLYGFIAMFSFYGQSLLYQAGWTLTLIGVLTGIENGVGALFAALADSVARKFGERRSMTLCSVLSSMGLILFAWMPGAAAGGGYLLNSVASNTADPIINNGLNQLIPSEQRATLLSAHSTAFSLFMIFAFPLFGELSKHVGLTYASYIGSVIGAMCILCATVWWRAGDKR